jgi:hypothetical protein
VAEATAFCRAATWTWAVTMTDAAHWYVAVARVADPRVDALLNLIKTFGEKRRYNRRSYRFVVIDGWHHWITFPVINRRPEAVGGWDGAPLRDPALWVRDEHRRNLPGSIHADEVVNG